ncbi:MAG: hypothetical protein WCS12_03735 [Acholeplasmataceae bacterium]|jgi:hypothetical protein|nr:hypothetical protein [Acholeplasmataceae bacterium]MCK9234071.1 hypothetical protein [Acholeplasmataceae bacterium]MCK9288751.1 hypothetical protein [Acholeplasmataceae bacterium]MCK9427343.1 hypothetical protein [Acholeplasmataceae bacterium]MDD4090349.1 hypothetical protein [Acholeplasmataceae bacterium]
MTKRDKEMKRFFKRKRKRLRDKYDFHVDKDLEVAFERAKAFLYLSDEDIQAHTPIATDAPEALTREIDSKLIYFKDKIRFDIGRYFLLAFGDDLLHFYTAIIDHRVGEIYNDAGLSIPYKRITSVQTSLLFRNIEKRNFHIYELKLSVEGMKDINLVLRNSIVDGKTADENFELDQEVKDLLNGVVRFLREKIV